MPGEKISVPRARSRKPKSKIENSKAPAVHNGLSEAIMGFNPQSIGVQLSQADTLFRNNRWYLVSNMRQLLSEIYVEIGLIQTVVDVPVDDGLRGGIEIRSKQMSPEEVEELQVAVDQDGLLRIMGQALKWNRLYGGAGIVMITNQDPESELNIDSLKEGDPVEFRAVDMWELFWDKQNTEPYNVEIQEQEFTWYSYYGQKIHKSRVMALKGIEPPSFIRPRLRGWGVSIVETLVRSINQYLKATDLSFEVLDEFKLDIFKIKNLTNTLLSPDGTTAVRQRVQLANQQKNYQNALTMDAEDDYVQKQLSFAGLSETMAQIRMQVASDLRMPLTKIFGISAQGFNSGEDDIENYNAMVESQIREKSKYDILKMLTIKCITMFGYVPDDLQIDFKPLRMLSSEQEENVKTQKFNRYLAALQAGAISGKEFKDGCNKDKLFSVTLEDADDDLKPEEGQDAVDGGDVDIAKEPKDQAPRSKLEAPKAKNEMNPDDGRKT